MKSKMLITVRNGLLAGISLCGIQMHTFAADVTGSRLDIGGNETLSAASTDSSIAGGFTNSLYATYSTIAGGYGNEITNTNDGTDFIGGGSQNLILSSYAAVGGGYGHEIDGDLSFVGGGEQNFITGSQSDHSVIVGGLGNSIVSNELCFIGGGTGNTMLGYYGVIGGGYINTNSGDYETIAGGGWNLAGGDWSMIPGGAAARTTLYGQFAHASGSFTYPDQGDAQTSECVLRNESTSTNSTELFLDGTSLRMVLPTNGTWSYDILVSVRETNGNSGGFHTNGVIKAYNGAITMVGGVNPINVPAIAADVSSWKVSVSADTSNGSLDVKVNGDASTNRWVATVRTTEVKF